MWYLQFFFYAGLTPAFRSTTYISWMLHMSFYVLCGGIVGLVLKEWNNAGRRPVTVLSLGCVVIIVAAHRSDWHGELIFLANRDDATGWASSRFPG